MQDDQANEHIFIAPSGAEMTDVIIVGAGPTGLMAAALLRRCGISVRILDKSPTQAKESRAFGVQARSMELFLKIGLADELLDRGLIAAGAQVYVDGKQAAALNFDDIGRNDTPYQYLLMVPQSEIEAVLVADIGKFGVVVERGVEVTGLEQLSDTVLVRAALPAGEHQTLACRYVIGADGAHSVVRKALGLSFEGAAYPQTFLLADCRVEWPLDYDHFKIMVHGRGLGIYLPLKGRDIARIMTVEPDPPAADEPGIASQGASPVTIEEVEAAFRDATGIDARLSDPVWTTRYRVHHRGVDRYAARRVFVAGDAAHIHSPAGGQGMNTGLQDAANLAWKLALVLRDQADSALLDSYHEERWPVGQRVLSYTDRVFSFVTAQAGWVASLRNTVLPIFAATVSRLGMVRNRAFHFISQLGIRYEPGLYVRDEVSDGASKSFRDALTAGHRAPNAAIGRHRDVFDLITGYRFHLLALSRMPLSAEDIGRLTGSLANLVEGTGLDLVTHVVAHSLVGRDARVIQAEESQVFQAYGLDGETAQALYLIRPDGYIAWRTDGLDVDACRAFLDRSFGLYA